MNLNHAHKYKQQGISLIELIVASSISLIAIATVGSIYLAGNKMVVARTSQLMIKQDVNDTLKHIATEIRRAGYTTTLDESVTLSGSSSTVDSSATNIGFVYEDENGKWRGIKFPKKNALAGTKTIQICQKISSSSALSTMTDFTFSNLCSGAEVASLVDYKNISINNFNVSTSVISTAQSTAMKVDVFLDATLIGTTYTHAGKASIVLRNIQ